jgi:hypothetical protein
VLVTLLIWTKYHPHINQKLYKFSAVSSGRYFNMAVNQHATSRFTALAFLSHALKCNKNLRLESLHFPPLKNYKTLKVKTIHYSWRRTLYYTSIYQKCKNKLPKKTTLLKKSHNQRAFLYKLHCLNDIKSANPWTTKMVWYKSRQGLL